jgi:hypothetical protein
MRARPRFDGNQIAYRNEFDARAGCGNTAARALVVRIIVICGGNMRSEPFRRSNFWRDSGRQKPQKLAAKMRREAGQVFPPPFFPMWGSRLT